MGTVSNKTVYKPKDKYTGIDPDAEKIAIDGVDVTDALKEIIKEHLEEDPWGDD